VTGGNKGNAMQMLDFGPAKLQEDLKSPISNPKPPADADAPN